MSDRRSGAASPRGWRFAWTAVWGVAVALRVALAWVNREANDAHVEVVRRILEAGRLPYARECWECFQPKLYHVTLAGLAELLGWSSEPRLTLLGNAASTVAGLATLALVGWFVARLEGPASLRWLAFALCALNPKLIAISSQATNDAFVILFATLALLAARRWLARERALDLAAVVLCLLLAVSSKSNGWVGWCAVVGAVTLRAGLDRARRRRAVAAALVVLLGVPLLAALIPLMQVRQNLRRHGAPLLLNIERQRPPSFWARDDLPKAGIRSIAEGFLTFRCIGLLEEPRISNDAAPVPLHRTSLWTQLYGRAHAVTFDDWPPSWREPGRSAFPRLRAIYLLAALPTALLLGGLLGGLGALVREVARRDLDEARRRAFGLLPLALAGHFAFVALYAWLYRDYTVMKAIFLLPALPAFPALFLTAARRLSSRARAAALALGVPLLVLYVAEILALLRRLA